MAAWKWLEKTTGVEKRMAVFALIVVERLREGQPTTS